MKRHTPLRRLNLCLVALLALALPLAGSAAAKPKKKVKAPQVFVFVIDGLDRDAVTADGDAPFLSKLIAGNRADRGTFFSRSRSVMVSETNPNHTSMLTGAYPETHGIAGNEFAVFGPTANEDSCPASEVRSTGLNVTSGESPGCLTAETIYAAMERQKKDGKLTSALISGKPKLARLFATQEINPGTYDADYIWAPCDDDEPYCEEVPTNPLTGYAEDDSVVMDEVIRVSEEGVEDAGKSRKPDFVFANLPLVDSAGHATGRTSPVYTAAVTAADQQIQRFVQTRKRQGTWDRTAMMIVSDHSMDDTPQINKISLATLFTVAGVPSSAYEIVGNGGAAHVYLTNRAAPNRNQLLADMRGALDRSSAINQALYRLPNPADGGNAHTIAEVAPGWNLSSPRSGDIVVSARPGVAVLETSDVNSFPFNPLPGNHGSTFTRGNFWLAAGGSKAVRNASSKRRITNAAVAPTAARLLGIRPPNETEAAWAREGFNKKFVPKRKK